MTPASCRHVKRLWGGHVAAACCFCTAGLQPPGCFPASCTPRQFQHLLSCMLMYAAPRSEEASTVQAREEALEAGVLLQGAAFMQQGCSYLAASQPLAHLGSSSIS